MQRRLATLICMAALMLKLLVPTGYMIAGDHGRLAITTCPGVASQPMTRDMSAMHGTMPGHGQPKDHDKADMPCAFAGLSLVSLGAVDPVLLATFVAFVMALGLAGAIVPASFPLLRLRPPSQAPPAHL